MTSSKPRKVSIKPISLLLPLAFSLLAACSSPCARLEREVCESLGEEDCRLWRDEGGPDLLAKMCGGDAEVCSCVLASPEMLRYVRDLASLLPEVARAREHAGATPPGAGIKPELQERSSAVYQYLRMQCHKQ